MQWLLQTIGGIAFHELPGGKIYSLASVRNKSIVLLTLLAWMDREIDRVEIAALLWPESSLDAQLASLRNELSSLRRTLAKTAPGMEKILLVSRGKNSIRLGEVETDVRYVRQSHALQGSVLPYCNQLLALPVFLPRFDGRDWWDGLDEVKELYDTWDAEITTWRRTKTPGRPASPTRSLPLIGRERELSSVRDLLSKPQSFVTLLGPPGVGKTRLATEICLQEGGHFVDVTDARSEGALRVAVAASLGLGALRPESAAPEAIALRLKGRVLVLDNLETVLQRDPEGVRVSLKEMHRVGIRLLVTSRTVVDVPGELHWQVTPLSVPTANDEIDALRNTDAVRLFVAAIRQRDSTFKIGPRNATSIRQICRQLDGLPLSLELAAARAGSTTMAGLEREVSSGEFFGINVRNGRRKRDRSLQAALGVSTASWDSQMWQFFSSLGVLVANFDTSLAAAMTGFADAAERLEYLYNISMVQRLDNGSWHLLETIRLLARRRLTPENRTQAEESYSNAVVKRVFQLPRVFGAEAFEALERDWPHILHALEQLLVYPERFADLALRIRSFITARWLAKQELIALMPVALRHTDTSHPARTILNALHSELLLGENRIVEAEQIARETLASVPPGIGYAASASWHVCAFAACHRSDHFLALSCAQNALATSIPETERLARQRIAAIHIEMQDFSAAIDQLQEGLRIVRQIGDIRGEVGLLRSLGSAFSNQGLFQEAFASYSQALKDSENLGDEMLTFHLTLCKAESLACLGEGAAAESELEFLERHPYREQLTDTNLGMYYKVQGQYFEVVGKRSEAVEVYTKALEIFQRCGPVIQQKELIKILARLR